MVVYKLNYPKINLYKVNILISISKVLYNNIFTIIYNIIDKHTLKITITNNFKMGWLFNFNIFIDISPIHITSIIIPNDIYITYKTKKLPNYIISNIKKLNPTYTIHLYDDNDCIKFLNKFFSPKFVKIFNNINQGMYKADLWRLCILYIYGGVYCDVDLEHIVPINKIRKYCNNSILITCIELKNNGIFQSFNNG